MSSEVESVTSMAQLTPTAGGWIAAGLAGVVGAGLTLRRRLSRDRTEIVKDRQESTFHEQVMARAIAAEAALQRRAEDMAVIARLQAENDSHKRDLERLAKEFHEFKRLMMRLYPDARRFFATQQSDDFVDPR